MRREQGPAWRRPLAAAAVVAAAVVLAGLALGESRHAEAASLPSCAAAGAPVAVPPGLAAFPLPRGTVIDGRERRYGYTFVHGRVPGAINPVRDWLLGRVPPAGYRITGGDAEAAEAEAAFAGHGGIGRWKVHELPGCAGALSIEIAFRPR